VKDESRRPTDVHFQAPSFSYHGRAATTTVPSETLATYV
jgi:hypothetical protein